MHRTEKMQSWVWDEGRALPESWMYVGQQTQCSTSNTVRKSMMLNTQHCAVDKEGKLYFYKLFAKVKRSSWSQKYELPPRQISEEKEQWKSIFWWTERQCVNISDLAILFSHLQLSLTLPPPFKINRSSLFYRDLFSYSVSCQERHL